MCGSVDMSYACLSVCLCLPFYGIFSRLLFAHFNSIERRCCKEMRGPAKCATHLCLCVRGVFVFGCKLKRSSSHTKTTTRTSALMLHLPCLFTASCPFVGHTHTYIWTHGLHMCENGFYFNPFFSPLLVFVPLIVCFVLRIHQH